MGHPNKTPETPALRQTPDRHRTGASDNATIAKLSSGLRITRDHNKAIGQIVSRGLKADILTLDRATRTAIDDLSVSESALDPVLGWAGAVGRMKELSRQLVKIQSRIESTSRNLNMTTENLSAANVQIRDVDIAMETSCAASFLVLQQVGMFLNKAGNVPPRRAFYLLRN